MPTIDKAGDGEDLVLPKKLDFENPIQAIHHIPYMNHFKFETKDGFMTEHPDYHLKYDLKRFEIDPSKYNKILIRFNSHSIQGFRFLHNNKTIFEVGEDRFGNSVEVTLEEGERLVGIRSKLYDDSTVNNTCHCNLVLVIGKLVSV